MKRMATLLAAVAALSLILAFSSMGFAQDNTPRAARGARIFNVLDPNNTGTITKQAFMAEAQQRAEKSWARIDPTGKGSVTREEFMAGRAHKGGKHGMRGMRGMHSGPADSAAPQQ